MNTANNSEPRIKRTVGLVVAIIGSNTEAARDLSPYRRWPGNTLA